MRYPPSKQGNTRPVLRSTGLVLAVPSQLRPARLAYEIAALFRL